MKKYRVELIRLSGPKTDAQIAGTLSHEINRIQTLLGDQWELVNVATSPYSAVMTTWRAEA